MALVDGHSVAKNLCHLTCGLPAKVDVGQAPPSRLTSHTANKCPFYRLCSAMVSLFLRFLLVNSLFKMFPKHCAEVPARVPQHQKAVMGLREKIHMLDKLYSGPSYDAVGHEFGVC